MINMLKSDVYRIRRSRSFKITVMIFVLIIAMLYLDLGIQSRSAFAFFDPTTSTISDFLYYFPKAPLFVMVVFIYQMIFIGEEYQKNYIKNIYPYFQNKWQLVLSRYFIGIIIYLLFSLIAIFLAFLLGIIIDRELGTINFIDYLFYLLTQAFLNETFATICLLVLNLFRNATISILLGFGYVMQFVYMLEIVICEHFRVELYQYGIYYLSGNLPVSLELDKYGQSILISLVMTAIILTINYLVLKKKDL